MCDGMMKPLDDPLEAAAMRAKLKQQKMRQAKQEREASKKDGYISKSVMFKDTEQEGNSEDEEFYDSDAMVYDSEEEAEQEALHQ